MTSTSTVSKRKSWQQQARARANKCFLWHERVICHNRDSMHYLLCSFFPFCSLLLWFCSVLCQPNAIGSHQYAPHFFSTVLPRHLLPSFFCSLFSVLFFSSPMRLAHTNMHHISSRLSYCVTFTFYVRPLDDLAGDSTSFDAQLSAFSFCSYIPCRISLHGSQVRQTRRSTARILAQGQTERALVCKKHTCVREDDG